ncbi:hypothetical protein LPJ61_002161 [Coemansia biformis]|uniref:Homeobox domain-containing protein n=1 Tax=Coemansia biformis TaxID=1286918 RepID=A0A9W7YF23_9FUNG|nr:hypothetical protein LPJ61_002161 [Coemansia biformis]
MGLSYAQPYSYQLRSPEQEHVPLAMPLPPAGADFGYFLLPPFDAKDVPACFAKLPGGGDAPIPGLVGFDSHLYISPAALGGMLNPGSLSVPPQTHHMSDVAAAVAAAVDMEAQLHVSYSHPLTPRLELLCDSLYTSEIDTPAASHPASTAAASPLIETPRTSQPHGGALAVTNAGAAPAHARARRSALFLPREVTDEVSKQYCPAMRGALAAMLCPADLAMHACRWCRPQGPPAGPRGAMRRPSLGARTHTKCYDDHVNRVLYGWLEQNMVNPYPSPQAKLDLMKKSGLSKMQLKNWFCNVRRRKLPDTIKHQKSCK